MIRACSCSLYLHNVGVKCRRIPNTHSNGRLNTFVWTCRTSIPFSTWSFQSNESGLRSWVCTPYFWIAAGGFEPGQAEASAALVADEDHPCRVETASRGSLLQESGLEGLAFTHLSASRDLSSDVSQATALSAAACGHEELE